jgi:hypothetical protein
MTETEGTCGEAMLSDVNRVRRRLHVQKLQAQGNQGQQPGAHM